MTSPQQSFEAVGGSTDDLGGGACFWVYVSSENDTQNVVTHWSVTFTQGDWSGTIDSSMPAPILQTNGLSGDFQVSVTGSGPNMPAKQLGPGPGCEPNIGCNANCASMVAIVANPSGDDASYCTTWDAFCKKPA